MNNKAVSILSITLVIVSVVLVIVSFGKAMDKATEQPTLRDKLSQPVSMVASFEVKGKHHGVYQLVNINGDELDQGDYALDGDYSEGDVVTVLWADDSGEEIAGEVLVGKAIELDLPHGGEHK